MVVKLGAEEKLLLGVLVFIAVAGGAAHTLYKLPPLEAKLRGFGPSDLMVGQEVNAIVDVKNHLNIARTYRLEVKFDDRSSIREIYLPPRRWKTVYFTFVADKPGEHALAVGDDRMTVSVDPHEEPQENAKIEIARFYYGPLLPMVREEINTRVLVYNSSEFPGKCEVKVKVGDEVMRKEVLVRGKQSLWTVFTTVKGTEGRYKIEVENCRQGPGYIDVTLSELLKTIRDMIARAGKTR